MRIFRPITLLALLVACGSQSESVAPDENTAGEGEVVAPAADERPPGELGEGQPGVTEPSEGGPVEGTPEANGTIECTTSDDCPEGQMCSGAEGCATAWTCQPPRPCTRDLVVYCSCRGETVRGSGSCPPEPYAHRGPC